MAPSNAETSAKTTRGLWTRSFIVGSLINFLIMTNYFMPMVVMTDYAMTAYGASASVAGLVASIFIVGALFSRLASGTIIARVGASRALTCALTCELLFSCVYFADLGLGPLFALRFAHGFAYGLAGTTVGAMVTAAIPDERKGEGVGYFMLSTTLGTALGPFLGMALVSALGIGAVFAGCVATAIVCLVGLLGMSPHGASRAPSPTRAVASGSAAKRDSGIRALVEPAALPISLVACIIFFGYSSVLTFLSPYAQAEGLEAAANLFFVAYAAATFVSRLFTGKLFDRRGALVVMIPSFAIAALGFGLVGLAESGIVLICGAFCLGFGVGTVQSCGLTIAVKQTDIGRISFANSTYFALTDLGVGIGPLVLGTAVPALGYHGLYLAMVSVVALDLVVYLLVELSMRRAQKHAGQPA